MMLAQAAPARSVNSRIFAGLATVATLAAIVRAAGGFKIIAMAHVLGASAKLDAFLFAFLVPSFFSDVVASSLTSGIIPVLTSIRVQHDEGRTHRLTASILAASTVLLLIIACTLALLAKPIVELRGASGAATNELARALLWGLLPWLPLMGPIVCWRAILNMHEQFVVAAAAPVATPVLTIFLLYIGGRDAGVQVLCYGTWGGALIEALVVAWAVRQMGYPLLPRWSGWTPDLRAVCKQYLPVAAGALIISGSALVDQAFASRLTPGTLSALSYGTKLTGVVLTIAGTALTTAALPYLSRMSASRDWHAFRHTVTRYAIAAVLAGAAAAAVLIFLSGPLVRGVLQHGAFTAQASSAVTILQRFSLLQLPLAFLLALGFATAAALKANRLMLTIAPLALFTTLLFDYTLMRLFGAPGIAVSPALTDAVCLTVLFVLLRPTMRRKQFTTI
ncbi:MAG: lipid II flippase MurJ [Bryobacteraceae bacterium]|jgi:putative peptidoglycan lipid II flippase